MNTKIVLSTQKLGLAAFAPAGDVFRKDFIRVGNWRIPNKDGTHTDLVVTSERLSKWQKHFELFRQRGISVPLTVDHFARRVFCIFRLSYIFRVFRAGFTSHLPTLLQWRAWQSHEGRGDAER